MMTNNSATKANQAVSDINQTKITSLDVAKLAGVSQSAVSRVFTEGASVSAKTAEKVQNPASERLQSQVKSVSEKAICSRAESRP